MKFDTYANSVKLTLSRYADFQGRSTRAEYWCFFLFNLTTAFLAVQVDKHLLSPRYSILTTAVALVLLIPGIAVAIRRLHDIGKSGWLLLLALVPVAGFVALVYFFVQPSRD